MSKPWENKPWEANSNSWKNPEYKKNNEAWKNPPYKAMNATWQDKWGTRETNEKIANMEPGLYFKYTDSIIGRLIESVFAYAGVAINMENSISSKLHVIKSSVFNDRNRIPQSPKLRELLRRAVSGIGILSNNPIDSPYILRFRNDIPNSVFSIFEIGISERLCAQMNGVVGNITKRSSGTFKIPEYILVCWIAHEIVEQMYYLEESDDSIIEVYSNKKFKEPIYEDAHDYAVKYSETIFQELTGYENAQLFEALEDDRINISGDQYTKIYKYSKEELQKVSPRKLIEYNFNIQDLKLEGDPIYKIRSLEQSFVTSGSIQRLIYSWWWVYDDEYQKRGVSNYNLTSYASNIILFESQGVQII